MPRQLRNACRLSGPKNMSALQTPRARAQIAAAVLFVSGILIGGILGRLSAWVLPAQVTPPSQMGQISRALEPPTLTQAAEKTPAQPEEKASSDRQPIQVAAPPAPIDNAAHEPEQLGKPMVPPPPAAAQNEDNPAAFSAQRTEPPTSNVTLLNPGAAQASSVEEQSTQVTGARNDKGADADAPRSHRRRDRRAGLTGDDISVRRRDRENRRNYRDLREEMLRRD